MKKHDTKIHIVDSAIDLFWRKSYHGVSMNELSAEAGVNKATIYQHFASKEELAIAAVARAADSTTAYIYQYSFDHSDNPETRLKTIFSIVYEMHRGIQESEGHCRGCPFVNLGVELSTSNDRIRAAVDSVFSSFREYYAQIAGPGAKQSKTAASLMAIMNGCLVAAKIENRPETILDGQKRALALLAG